MVSDTFRLLRRVTDRSSDVYEGRRMVFLSAYACAPGEGSEPGVGWAWFCAAKVAAATLDADLILFTRVGNQSELLSAGHGVGVVRVSTFPWFDRRRSSAPRWHATVWGVFAAIRMRQLVRRERVGSATVHHVTYATSSVPSPLWFVPSSWRRILGPVGSLSANSLSGRGGVKGLSRTLMSNLVEAVSVRRADHILAQNEGFAARCRDRYGVYADVEPNAAIERTILIESESVDLGFLPRSDRRRIICAGHLVPRKRFDLVIKALAEPCMLNVDLIIAGDGPERGYLYDLARELGVSDRTVFVGQRSRVETLALIRSACANVLPSDNESAGWVVAEAATLGIPSVVIRGTGAETLVNLCGFGKVIDPSVAVRAGALAAEICELVGSEISSCSVRWLDQRLPSVLTETYSTAESRLPGPK